jgi:hypothetical protein
LSVGSQSILTNIDSLLQRPKAKVNDKVSSRNKLKDSSNISSEHKLFKQTFGRLGFFK